MKTLNYYIDQWNLKLTDKPVATPTGVIAFTKDAVLKISTADDEQTALVLSHYNGHGAVKVLRSEDNVVLLERALPGVHLREMTGTNDNDATQILCQVIRDLHSNKELLALPDIAALQESFTTSQQQIPRELVEQASNTFINLLNSQDNSVVLHGDLHHDNVVFDSKRGWLAIDPKGYIGEPAFEVGAMLRNPKDVTITPAITLQRVDIIAKQLHFDKDRIIKWAFAQAVLAAIWCVEDDQPHEWALKASLALRQLL